MLRGVPLLVACALSNAVSPAIVKVDPQGSVTLYSLVEIKPHDRIRFQFPAADRSTRCCIQRRGSDFQLVDANPAAQDAESAEPARQYRLGKPVKAGGRALFIGSTVVSDLRVRQLPDSSLQVGRSSSGEVIKSCTSQEGVHVVHEALGRRRSDIYLGLGYDIETPSCEAK